MNVTRPVVTDSCTAPTWLSITYAVIGISILLENAFMIVIIRQTPRLDTIGNIFVISLAATDALVGLTTSLAGIFLLCMRSSERISKDIFYCLKGVYAGMLLCEYVQVTLIAIDRYTYIAYPFFHSARINKGFVLKAILCSWIVPVVFMLIMFFVREKPYNCIEQNVGTLGPALAISCISVFLLLITCVAYLKIAVLSFKHRRSIAALNVARNDCSRQSGNTEMGFDRESLANVRKSIRFFLVMTGFLAGMTILPAVCILAGILKQVAIATFWNVVLFVPPLHSATNFFINIFMNPDFRSAVRRKLVPCM